MGVSRRVRFVAAAVESSMVMIHLTPSESVSGGVVMMQVGRRAPLWRIRRVADLE